MNWKPGRRYNVTVKIRRHQHTHEGLTYEGRGNGPFRGENCLVFRTADHVGVYIDPDIVREAEKA